MTRNVGKTIQTGLIGLALACTACAQDKATPPGEATENSVPAESVEKTLEQQLTIAKADLIDRAGVDAAAIKVNQARAVNWGSGAVGCPEEGMGYTMAIVPGVLLLLEVDGKIYRYHGQTGRSPFFCPDDRAEAPAFGSGEELM